MSNTLISASLCEQPDDYETGSDTESDEEDDFEVVLSSGYVWSVRDWCVSIYEAGVLFFFFFL